MPKKNGEFVAWQNILGMILVPAAAALLLTIALSAEPRQGFASSELLFTDWSPEGLSIMPASCASHPSYYHGELTAQGAGYSIGADQLEYGAYKHGVYVCATNTTGYGIGGGGAGAGGGTSPTAAKGGRYGGGGGGAGGAYGTVTGGNGRRGMIVISYTTTAGVQHNYLLSSLDETTWVVPSNWNSAINSIRCIGGGGGGGAARGSATAATGGGGGAFSRSSNVVLTPGATVSYQVGAGGEGGVRTSNGTAAGGAGGDTWFGATTFASGKCAAKGGAGGNGRVTSGTLTGALGGAAASGIGTNLKYSGGNSGSVTVASGKPSSGGGGAAGAHGNGGDSPTVTGGGGAGGTGDGGNTAAGADGTQYGIPATFFIPANSAAELNSFKNRSSSYPGLLSW